MSSNSGRPNFRDLVPYPEHDNVFYRVWTGMDMPHGGLSRVEAGWMGCATTFTGPFCSRPVVTVTENEQRGGSTASAVVSGLEIFREKDGCSS